MKLKRIFHYYWQIVRNYKIAVLFVMLFGASRMLFGFIVSGYVYKSIIDTLNQTLIPIKERYEISIAYLIALTISLVTSVIIPRWSEYTYFRFLSRTMRDIYNFCFARLLKHSYAFFTNNFAGSLMTRIKRFNQAFNTMADLTLNNFLQLAVAIVLAFISMSFQSKRLAIYLVVWCFLYFIVVIIFSKQKIKLDLKAAESDSIITGFLADTISNILNIKIFSAYNKELDSFDKHTNEQRIRRMKAFTNYVIRIMIQSLLMVSFHAFILYTMINLWSSGVISVGVFVMAYVYLIGIFDRIWDLSHAINKFAEAMTDAKEMVDILDKPIQIKDIDNPEEIRIIKGEIIFENVSFEYLEDREVFENFDLKIKAGEKVGLVGHSGSGKSTFTKILLRFADVKSGSVTIDGQDIRNVKQEDLRSKISYVPQDPILFHRSIAENIGYSKGDATREEIIESAKKAHAHEFISLLKDGYDTFVGERGVKLSGGERQRVAIARAMLKDAPIIILDEATSSLDSMSESYIQDAFKELMKGKTAIVIAHRLSTIQRMDRIIVLDKGKIIEDGTHSELLSQKGLYSKLWNQQTAGFID